MDLLLWWVGFFSALLEKPLCVQMLAAPSTRTGHEKELKGWAETHILACSCWKPIKEKMARVQDHPLVRPLRWPSIPFTTVEVGEIQGELRR